jgi:hypothetical protein
VISDASFLRAPNVLWTLIEYQVSYHKASPGDYLSLIDRGANGGVAVNDSGLSKQDSQWRSIVLLTISAWILIYIYSPVGIQTQKGPIIIVPEYTTSTCWYEFYGTSSNVYRRFTEAPLYGPILLFRRFGDANNSTRQKHQITQCACFVGVTLLVVFVTILVVATTLLVVVVTLLFLVVTLLVVVVTLLVVVVTLFWLLLLPLWLLLLPNWLLLPFWLLTP